MAVQGRTWETVIFCEGEGGMTGLGFEDMTVEYHKTGGTELASKTLAEEDVVELGAGFYALKWSEAEMDTLGEFMFRVTGSFATVVEKFNVDPVPLVLGVPASKCLISGNVVDIGGAAIDCEITFRVVKVPARSGGSLVTGTLLRTDPDALGNFSVSLLRGMTVVVDIQQAGVRYQFTVPDQETADLVDLLPPIT